MSRRETKILNELRGEGFTALNRKQWGSNRRGTYQARRVTRRFVGPADHFFAHVTVTRDTGNRLRDFKADCRTVEEIGWSRFRTGTSYNWMVDQKSGDIALGMPLDAAGAHTINNKNVPGFPNNLNYWGHAIVWIGNVGDVPSQRAKDAYAAIIAAEKKHGAAKDGAEIYPHSKFAAKSCPLPVMTAALPGIMRASRSILAAKPAPKKRKPKPTRITLAKVRIAGTLEILDAAVRGGRKGRVAKVRSAIRRQSARLPRR